MNMQIPLTQGLFAIVDAADYRWLSQFKWLALKSDNTFYAARAVTTAPGRQRTVFMHREITNAPDGMQVDHVNSDGLDNRRENLRICTNMENQWNSRKPITNTSGFKGVCWDKSNARWMASIRVDGVRITLGRYDDIQCAARAYDFAALALRGEYARLNLT